MMIQRCAITLSLDTLGLRTMSSDMRESKERGLLCGKVRLEFEGGTQMSTREDFEKINGNFAYLVKFASLILLVVCQ